MKQSSENSNDPLVKALRILIVERFFNKGPKAGDYGLVSTSAENSAITFEPKHTERPIYRKRSPNSERLYWDVTVQDTWLTSVQRRGLSMVDGHPILFARRLQTKNWETFEVVALKRGHGFTASVIKGFVLRLGEFVTFSEDRNRAIKRIRAEAKRKVIARFAEA